jgi:predicted esterase YcpF (UPF0227 family)
MIIYIHGFGSSGRGMKSLALRDYFKNQNIPMIAPSLSYIPELAIDTLEQLIDSYDEEIVLMGSSLGGFYSIYLAEKYGLKAVLINPAVDSSKTLKRVLSIDTTAKNYYDDSRFTWNENHVNMLLKYRVSEVKNGTYFLLTQTDDEVLDYQEAVEKLSGHQMIVEEGGDHAFTNIESYFEEIKSFISS